MRTLRQGRCPAKEHNSPALLLSRTIAYAHDRGEAAHTDPDSLTSDDVPTPMLPLC